jgi:hypothetical protein
MSTYSIMIASTSDYTAIVFQELVIYTGQDLCTDSFKCNSN